MYMFAIIMGNVIINFLWSSTRISLSLSTFLMSDFLYPLTRSLFTSFTIASISATYLITPVTDASIFATYSSSTSAAIYSPLWPKQKSWWSASSRPKKEFNVEQIEKCLDTTIYMCRNHNNLKSYHNASHCLWFASHSVALIRVTVVLSLVSSNCLQSF